MARRCGSGWKAAASGWLLGGGAQSDSDSLAELFWKIYSSELIVWLGTMVRMLPCKLNNSCPLFNLFDLDYNNLLCALDIF